MDYGPIVAACGSMLVSTITGLIVWGLKSEVNTLRAENETLRTELRGDVSVFRADMSTLRAEVRAGIAEAGLEFYKQVNGTYVKSSLYGALVGRVDGLENRINDIGD